MNSTIKRVVIAGGGTAGWMTAAALTKLMGKNISVTLVESEDIGTVGVGEATIPTLHIFHHLLGLNEAEVMRETNATFKLGISFEGWHRENEKYFHSFGFLGQDCWACSFHHFWIKGKKLGISNPIGEYCREFVAAMQQRFYTSPKSEKNHAYHLDAGLYAKYLRRFAERYGVNRVEGKIQYVKMTDEGKIDSLVLESGELISGDLFVDCTGFSALLIEGALHTGYEDWGHWLPCDRAVTVQTQLDALSPPYTRSIAHESGWQWSIPLQTRVGNGLVYCSHYLSDDEALAKLKSNVQGELLNRPTFIRFKTGTRRRHWNQNCVAIGLASGFVEPLESTSIHLIQRSIIRLLQYFPKDGICDSAVDSFNQKTQFELENIRDFIILHYNATQRRDSDFWRHCSQMAIPKSLQSRIQLFKETGAIFKSEEELFGIASWVQVLLGQGIEAESYHPIVDQMTHSELEGFLSKVRAKVFTEVSEWGDVNKFLSVYRKADEGLPPREILSFSDVKIAVREAKGSAAKLVRLGPLPADYIRALVSAANSGKFEAYETYYPGIRCPMPSGLVAPLVENIRHLIMSVYGLAAKHCRLDRADFSLVTWPPEKLHVLQRIPHFDTPKNNYFAVLIYLSKSQHGGTGFFSHKETGICRVDSKNYKQYMAALEASGVDNLADAVAGYLNSSTRTFELIDQLDFEYGHVVIYPGNLLHSVLINEETDLSSDVSLGRLTANLFLEFNDG